MSAARDRARLEIIRYAHRMQAERLVHSTAGNLSTRVEGEPAVIAMSPTSLAYDTLEPADVCLVAASGGRLEGDREPTSELPLHSLLYTRRPEVGAIVHTHSPAAMTMAVLGWRLPPILTGLVDAVGGDVRCAPYTRPGTPEMADSTAQALADRGACFMRHHGLLTIGADLGRAFHAASVTEGAARVYLDARAQGVEVPELEPDDVASIARGWWKQWESA